MLRSQLLEKAMRVEWRSPHDLCYYLGLTPTEIQREVFDSYAEGQLDFPYCDEHLRAIYICLLWEVLSNPGRTAVIAGMSVETSWALTFISGAIDRKPELSSVLGVGTWGLRFGSDPAWSIRAVHDNPGSLQGLPARSTVLLLGAGSDWAVEVEKAAMAIEDVRLIRTF